MNSVSKTIVDTLVAQGITHAFAVPGESYLGVLDALFDVQDKLQLVTCRHEAGGANMAEAYGKLTGKAGVALVTRGPGATHAAIGVHTARQDSTPMLLFVGQVGTDMLQREAFQEIDYRLMFGSVAKRVVVIDRADRAAELVASAYATAVSGRPGPVVIVLPEDLLADEAPPALTAPIVPAEPSPDASSIAKLANLLADAERPILWIGGPGWSEESVANIAHFAEDARIPVVTSWRRKDRFDNAHPKYAGELGLGSNPKLVERVKSADLIIALGTRLGEVASQGYTLPATPTPAQKLVHIHVDGDTLGTVAQPVLAIQSSVRLAAAAFAELGFMIDGERWADWAEEARADYEAWVTPTTVQAGVNMAEVIAHVGSVVGQDAIFTNGAGNFASWLHRFHQHRRFGTQLAPTSGAMGYGVPAGIAAKIMYPAREVITVAGDGDFLMSAQELATAARYGANVIILVVDNAQYGTIRMHQARDFPGRQSGTALTNPDFAAFGRSFGAFGATVERTEDFAEAFAAARAAGTPAVIHLKTDPDEIAPGRRLTR
ncbi:thiamine pyrophosphate-dependent enzyme [Sphingoaurantiacus capsulatus]|uniref:Thiamine pyrophosphate-dependent enzyme n=1 Tax=Sphingoaurantiacus capsulatus TaxID=1771310 RepID=A0ABV7X8X9_9SPHN